VGAMSAASFAWTKTPFSDQRSSRTVMPYQDSEPSCRIQSFGVALLASVLATRQREGRSLLLVHKFSLVWSYEPQVKRHRRVVQ
jgi:hypothetical protein